MGGRFVVLQHESTAHLGAFRPLIEAGGHAIEVIALDEGDSLPSLDGAAAVWALGGPMDVWEEDLHPWLAAEKSYIRAAVVDRGLPYFGVCLGHQLLADALGGEVGKGGAEIGVLQARPTGPSPLLDGLGDPVTVFQWHGAEVKRLPEGGRLLASSETCAVQAQSWGDRAFSMQSHPEVTADTVADWAAIPEAAAILERTFDGGAATLAAEVAQNLPRYASTAQRLYDNWCRATGIAFGI